MAPTDVNREEVERRKSRLLSEHDGVSVREEHEEVPADIFPDLRDLAVEGYTGGGYVWVVRDPQETAPLAEPLPDDIEERERVLMILSRGTSRWGLPGGGRECGETYEEAAAREVNEETGIECSIEKPFLIRQRVSVSKGDHDERLHTLWVFFDGRYEGGTIRVQPGELNGAAWFADPPERMHPENEFRAAEWNP
ncbi:NUDIX hydrolase [Halorientalis brevis]|uniref:NUDIX hydrolase n=1 Tax=Halorientalis brevis TaxID=1126241 RepID=A0ABD6CCF7_9EURY|nr:NUDIX domain-containing protein [Halorientalis brevis]